MLMAMMMPMIMACGSDDDESEDDALLAKAIGTWMCTQSTDSYRGYTSQGLLVGAQVSIKSDGTYTSTARTFGYSGTYTIKGNTITAKSGSGDTFMVTMSISGDKMTWKGTSSTGVTFNYLFVREG